MLGPAIVRRGRGPQKAPTKVLTSIRLDADVLAYFKALGDGYQIRINKALREFVADALWARLAAESDGTRSGEPKWMEGFGKLRRLRKETARIQGVIDEAFDVVEAEDRS
jgi:hypothetical protein